MNENIKFNEITNKYICPYCEKEYSNKGIGMHIWRNHTEEGKIFNPNKGYIKGTRQAWNKGLTKEINEIVKQRGETLKRRYINGEIQGSFKGKHHKKETKEKISKSIKKNFTFHHRFKNGTTSDHEQRIMNILKNNNIENFQHNYKIIFWKDSLKRRYIYDFAFENLLVCLEIDGWEHNLKKRIQTDKIRDELSQYYGWKTLRIKIDDIKKMSDDEIFYIINNFLIEAHKDIEQRHVLYNKNEYLLNEIQKKNKKLQMQKEKENKEKLIQEIIEKINNSNIDFTEYGCINKMSKITGISSQRCSGFLKKYIPDLYKLYINKKRD